MPIAELGHVGLMTHDLDQMRAFYTDVLGLTVTDQDLDAGLVFLSSRPGVEHHELVLTRGRCTTDETRLIQQISFRVDSLESLMEFRHRLLDPRSGARIQQEVTHGIAYGIYFWDPEGNRVEVYLRIDGHQDVPQPYRKHLNFDQDRAALEAEADRLLTEAGPVYPGASHQQH